MRNFKTLGNLFGHSRVRISQHFSPCLTLRSNCKIWPAFSAKPGKRNILRPFLLQRFSRSINNKQHARWLAQFDPVFRTERQSSVTIARISDYSGRAGIETGSLYLSDSGMNFSAAMDNYGSALDVTCATDFGAARHTRIVHFERVDRVMKKRTAVCYSAFI